MGNYISNAIFIDSALKEANLTIKMLRTELQTLSGVVETIKSQMTNEQKNNGKSKTKRYKKNGAYKSPVFYFLHSKIVNNVLSSNGLINLS